MSDSEDADVPSTSADALEIILLQRQQIQQEQQQQQQQQQQQEQESQPVTGTEEVAALSLTTIFARTSTSTSSSNNADDNISLESDCTEPPAKKPKCMNDDDIPSSSRQHEKLQARLGGILCCVICLDIPKIPMYQCHMGHLMCVACLNHLLADARLRDRAGATCPSCRAEVSKESVIRNLAVEKAVSELSVDCRFCNKNCLVKDVDHHENQECPKRPTNCKYSRLGCCWNGPYCEATEHESKCKQPHKTGIELMPILEANVTKAKQETKVYSTIIDLLSYENIIFHDLQLKPYRSDDFVHRLIFETGRFAAFNQQWSIKARINNSQREPHRSIDRTISYKLILKTKPITQPTTVHFVALRGPFTDMQVETKIYKHYFTEHNSASEYNFLPLVNSHEFNRLLTIRQINFRFLMFLLHN